MKGSIELSCKRLRCILLLLSYFHGKHNYQELMRLWGISAASAWSESQFLWIFAIISVDRDFAKEREHQKKRKVSLYCQANQIILMEPVSGGTLSPQCLEQTNWYSFHQFGVDFFCWEWDICVWVSPWLGFRSGEWLKEFFWKLNAFLLLPTLFL